jgi:hypothetical protein
MKISKLPHQSLLAYLLMVLLGEEVDMVEGVAS